MGVILKQSLKGTIVTYIGAAIGFLTTLFVTTEFLTPEEIGLTRVLFEAALLLSTFSIMGIGSSGIRYYPYFKTEDGKDNGFFRFVILFPLLGVVLFSLLFFAFKEPIKSYFSKESALFLNYYYLVIPLMVFVLYQTIMEVYCSVKQKIVIPRFNKEITLRLLLLVVYLSYALLHLSLDLFIYTFIAAYGVVTLLDFLYARSISPNALSAPIQFPKNLKSNFARYTTLLVLSSLGGSIVSRLDLFMVSAQMGLDYGGIYTIAFFIVAIIEIPSRSLSAISNPFAAEAIKVGDKEKLQELYRDIALYQMLIGGFIFILIWVNIDFIFRIIPNTPIYSQGKWVVFFLGMSKVVEMTFNYGNAVIKYSKYYYYSIAIAFLLTALTILTNLYFIPRLGMSGAAIATLISSIVGYGISQVIIKLKLKITPFSNRFLVLLPLLALLLGLNAIIPDLGINIWLSTLIKTIIFVLFPFLILLKAGIAPELSDYLNNFIRKGSK